MLSLRFADDAELRALEVWHADEFAEHIAAAEEHFARWLPWGHSAADSVGAAVLLNRYTQNLARDEGRSLGIWVGGKLSGGVLFRVWDNDSGMCELGAWLAPEATGRGLITKAATAMIDWAFQVSDMHRVEWRCAPGNEPSRRVAGRLGMTLEGTLREAFVLHDARLDVEVWSVLAREWLTKR